MEKTTDALWAQLLLLGHGVEVTSIAGMTCISVKVRGERNRRRYVEMTLRKAIERALAGAGG